MRISFFSIFVFYLYLFISPSVYADEVILTNGDKLSGEIVSKTDHVLAFKTSYAGTIKIVWAEVEHLSIDEAAHVILIDGTDIGNTTLATNTAASPKIQQIAEINPAIKPNFMNKGQVNFGLEIDRGNSDIDDYHLDSETEFRWLKDRLTFELSGDLEDSNGRSTQQNAELLTDYDHFLNEKLFASVGLLLEHEKFADLDLRTTLTSGIGYQIFENTRTNLYIEGGPGYIWENFDEDKSEDFPIAFWALQFDHYLFDEWKLQSFHNHQYNQSFERASDFIFTSSTGLRIPLANNLQATIQYNFDWDNTPSDNADEDDHETLITAGYRW